MPRVADAIAALDPARVAQAMRELGHAGSSGDGGIGITVAGREHTLSPEDVVLTLRAPDGYSVEREGAHAVALDLSIDDDLRGEGYAREIVHAVQGARKDAGLAVEDRIELRLDGERALLDAAHVYRDYIAEETLALTLALGEDGTDAPDFTARPRIDGLELVIALRRASAAEPG
jgi:isoleucyl-tRNA synthetase